MELQGKVISVLPERSGVSARGEWKSQSFVIETHEQYPKKLCFDVFGADRLAQFNIHRGEEILVSFDIDAHEYQGRFYNQVRAWNVVRQQPQGQQQQPQGGYQQPGQQWATNNPQAGAQAIPQAAQQAMRMAAPPQPQGSEEGLPF